jgi:hypothetical protein
MLNNRSTMNSTKTTILGILAILSAVVGAATALLDGNPATTIDFPTLAAAIAAGWGLIMARDNSKSSEAAGAK